MNKDNHIECPSCLWRPRSPENHYLDLDKASVKYAGGCKEVVPLLDNMEDFPGPDALLSSFTFLKHRTRRHKNTCSCPCSNIPDDRYQQNFSHLTSSTKFQVAHVTTPKSGYCPQPEGPAGQGQILEFRRDWSERYLRQLEAVTDRKSPSSSLSLGFSVFSLSL